MHEVYKSGSIAFHITHAETGAKTDKYVAHSYMNLIIWGNTWLLSTTVGYQSFGYTQSEVDTYRGRVLC